MGSNHHPIPLSKNEIESAVRKYWDLFAAKKTNEWQRSFADVALVFGSAAKRPEPVRLTVLRRQREYLTSQATMRIEIAGIDVEILGTDCAVAAYLMRWDAERIAKVSASGHKVEEEHLKDVRVTHVFQRQEDGAIRIVHEHISLAVAD